MILEMGELIEGSASEFTSILEAGEKIVLWPSGINSPSNQRLLLTDRRLVEFEGKGLFNQKYVKTGELPTSQMVEVYAKKLGRECYLMVKMRNGGEWQYSLNVPSSAVEVTTKAIMQQAVTERWVSAVRKLI